ncbi:MAG: efflux RND transporter periplasmic adaptor subunit [Flavobacteriaceae bacterium]|jgi:RND family efflux transporter MFP subunit|nr:efflux RND transporter periplasmic adaptor subunit [Flavobacteriaceae bacterium]MDG1686870.1 efflux RND transporter periplasmic adaptor subunit [Flavobacteriaceae bacterium]MDG2234950.1 efflux RND transporter periplasmic adaptor subunit [Flavobacteriaceae bacterium]|tara:strand:- start:5570 stop:6742 length:1173 start_codon:yes stop_codon:yes gene_type:complete
MKKIIYTLGISFLLINCSQEMVDTSNTNGVEGINLEELNNQKANYTQQINDLKLELEKINSAIDALGSSEKRTLITAFITETQSFEHQIEIQANIKTRQNVLIYPEFAGRLITLKVVEGQNVKKGNLLALIDDAGITDQLDQMILQLNLAKTTFERTQRLWDQKIGSEMMYLEAKTRYKAAQKQVSQIKQQLAKTKIYAPFNGVIDEIQARLGSNLIPGITPVLRIVNLNTMFAESDVPENYLSNITKGSKAKVSIPALNQIQNTEIHQTGNFITPSNRTFRVEARLENPEGLIKPNLNARLSVMDYFNPEAIMIPLRVVREDAKNQPYVFVLSKPEKDNGFTTEQRMVTVGKTKEEMVEILDGLTTGELVVEEGVSLLVTNQKVKRILE